MRLLYQCPKCQSAYAIFDGHASSFTNNRQFLETLADLDYSHRCGLVPEPSKSLSKAS